MDTRKQKMREERVRKINNVLKKLYPNPCMSLNYSSTWELLVAVQLSARCTDVRVNKVTKDLFKKYTTIESYKEASQNDIEKTIYQCGFYRNKAKNIRGAAKIILSVYDGKVPQTMKELLKIPGVARKTANVVLSSAFQIHEGVAVDTHVRRFAIRFSLTDYRDPVRIEKDLMEIMPKKEWWGFNHRLVHYGRDVCEARKHDCKEHPLTKIYYKANNVWPVSN